MTFRDFDLFNYGMRAMLELGVHVSVICFLVTAAFAGFQWGLLLRAERKQHQRIYS